MKKSCNNIYQIARKSTGFTQEQAAEMLHVSLRSLGAYETSGTIPPDDVVCKMIEVYNAPSLAYNHLKQSTEVGRKFLPAIDMTDLARSVLRLQKETNDLEFIQNDMINIACDGEITEEEKPTWNSVLKEISEIAGAALSLLFCQQNGKERGNYEYSINE